MIIVPAESASEQLVQIIQRVVPGHSEAASHPGVAGKLRGEDVLGDRRSIKGAGAVNWRRLSWAV